VPIHVLTGANGWQLAAWMLASFFHSAEEAWPIVVHDDGTLPEEGKATFTSLFKHLRVLPRAGADAVMQAVLKAYPFCQEYREMHPLAFKILDMPQFAATKRFMIFDSDLLFFRYPTEIMRWVSEENEECWFNQDVAEGSLLTKEEAKTELNINLWPRVNSGLCLLYRPAIDFDFCDRVLAQTSILRGHIWRIEQTLFAVCASRHGKGGLLPNRYEVSLGKWSADDAVARHYVGAVRNRFYGEGLKRLAPVLLA